ncbi:unnamed protein product, partial [Prorocentrum cordatum]
AVGSKAGALGSRPSPAGVARGRCLRVVSARPGPRRGDSLRGGAARCSLMSVRSPSPGWRPRRAVVAEQEATEKGPRAASSSSCSSSGSSSGGSSSSSSGARSALPVPASPHRARAFWPRPAADRAPSCPGQRGSLRPAHGGTELRVCMALAFVQQSVRGKTLALEAHNSPFATQPGRPASHPVAN